MCNAAGQIFDLPQAHFAGKGHDRARDATMQCLIKPDSDSDEYPLLPPVLFLETTQMLMQMPDLFKSMRVAKVGLF